MAEHFESHDSDRAAEAWAELKEHDKAAMFYTLAGDQHREDEDYIKARTSYLRAGLQYTRAGQHDLAHGMRQNVRDCEEHVRELERTEVMQKQADAGYAQARATREGFATLSQATREGFLATSQALINGFTTLAQAQREAAIESAKIVFQGLEQIASSQTEGFAQLASAIREGSLLQAISTYAAIKGLDRRNVEAANELKTVIANGLNSLSPAQKEAAARNTLKLFDVLTKMLPDGDPSVPGPLPKSIVVQIVDADTDRKRKETMSQSEAPERPVRVESSRCLLGSGPDGCVLNIARSDGKIYQQCTVAQATMTRRWHEFAIFSAKYLRQGGCPLPDSLGLLQRHLWYRTCYLADGSEHEKPRQ
jgi:hypothetical protein